MLGKSASAPPAAFPPGCRARLGRELLRAALCSPSVGAASGTFVLSGGAVDRRRSAAIATADVAPRGEPGGFVTLCSPLGSAPTLSVPVRRHTGDGSFVVEAAPELAAVGADDMAIVDVVLAAAPGFGGEQLQDTAEPFQTLPVSQSMPRSPRSDAEDLRAELNLLAANAPPGTRTYLAHLALAAADAAARGYGIRRETRTVRRTRMHKTTNTTDLRTMHTEQKVEQSTKVEQWVAQGASPVTGVGIVCARGRRRMERFEDGTEHVAAQHVNGQATLWIGGVVASDCPKTTFKFESSCGVDSTGPGHYFGPTALSN
mmetsp:Transcript_58621/g.169670  ORF Transcript_58621/g.169670 Transcript_58621/m.169670 type:complete len:316 (+) Transcript_58621:100-1047(+)